MNKKLRVLDLFSGIGGFSLGLERSEYFETVAFCEIDKACRKVLKKHWPEVPIYEDVKTLEGKSLGAIDVICGGFPCQDISTAGKGLGLTGARSGLWKEYLRLIKETLPRLVLIENVSALRSRGLGQVLREISEIGYDAEWHCITASSLGAPHRRDRVWIIAYPNSFRFQEMAHEALICKQAFNTWVTRRSKQMGSKAIWTSPRPSGCYPMGVGNGVSSELDRLKQCGNAVVPEIPELLGALLAPKFLLEESYDI